MNNPRTLLLAATFAAVSLAPPAVAQSCDAMLNDFNNWFQTKPNGPGNYWISFNMVTNRADGLYVGYAEASSGGNALLQYYPAHVIGPVWFPPSLQGDTRQFFSDRRYYPPGTIASDPFDPNNTGTTHVSIKIPTLGTSYVTITMPWGYAYAFTPSCQNGLMYGFSDVDNTIFVMSLNKLYFPPSPR